MRGLAAALLVIQLIQLTVPYASAQPPKGFDITLRKSTPGRPGLFSDVLSLSSATDANLELSFGDLPVSISTPILGPVDPKTGFAIYLPGRTSTKLNVVKVVKTLTGTGLAARVWEEWWDEAFGCMESEDCIKWPNSRAALQRDLTFTLWTTSNDGTNSKTPELSFRLHGCFPTGLRSNSLQKTSDLKDASNNPLVEELSLNFQKIEFLALAPPDTTTPVAADPPPECTTIPSQGSNDFTVDLDYDYQADSVQPYSLGLAKLKGVRLKHSLKGDEKIFVSVKGRQANVVRAYSEAGCRNTEVVVCDGVSYKAPPRTSSSISTPIHADGCPSCREAGSSAATGPDLSNDCSCDSSVGGCSSPPVRCHNRRQGLPETVWQHIEYREVDPAKILIGLLLPAVLKIRNGEFWGGAGSVSRSLLPAVQKRTFKTIDTVLLEAPILAISRAGIPEWLQDILTPSPTFPRTMPNPPPLYDSMLFGALNEIMDRVVDMGNSSYAFTVQSFFDIFLELAVDPRAGSEDGWLVDSFFDIWTELRLDPGRALGGAGGCEAPKAHGTPQSCAALAGGVIPGIVVAKDSTIGQSSNAIAVSAGSTAAATGALASLMCCPMQTPYPCADGSCASSESECKAPTSAAEWAAWKADTFMHIGNISIGWGWGRVITVSELVVPDDATSGPCVARKTTYEGVFPVELHMPSFASREFDSKRADYQDPTGPNGKTFRLRVKPNGNKRYVY